MDAMIKADPWSSTYTGIDCTKTKVLAPCGRKRTNVLVIFPNQALNFYSRISLQKIVRKEERKDGYWITAGNLGASGGAAAVPNSVVIAYRRTKTSNLKCQEGGKTIWQVWLMSGVSKTSRMVLPVLQRFLLSHVLVISLFI